MKNKTKMIEKKGMLRRRNSALTNVTRTANAVRENDRTACPFGSERLTLLDTRTGTGMQFVLTLSVFSRAWDARANTDSTFMARRPCEKKRRPHRLRDLSNPSIMRTLWPWYHFKILML